MSDNQKYILYISVVLIILLIFFIREIVNPINIENFNIDRNTIEIYND